MTKVSKVYVIADYGTFRGEITQAMYEHDDFRLSGKQVIAGTFKRDKTAKGLFNGGEVGFFTTVTNVKYLVFFDHSVRLLN